MHDSCGLKLVCPTVRRGHRTPRRTLRCVRRAPLRGTRDCADVTGLFVSSAARDMQFDLRLQRLLMHSPRRKVAHHFRGVPHGHPPTVRTDAKLQGRRSHARQNPEHLRAHHPGQRTRGELTASRQICARPSGTSRGADECRISTRGARSQAPLEGKERGPDRPARASLSRDATRDDRRVRLPAR